MRRFVVAPVLALLSILGVIGGISAARAAEPLPSGASVEVPLGQGPVSEFFNRFTPVTITGANPYTVTMQGPKSAGTGTDVVEFIFQPPSGQGLTVGTILDAVGAKTPDAGNGSVDLVINGVTCPAATGLVTIEDLALDAGTISRIALTGNVACNASTPSTISVWKGALPGPIGGVATSEFTAIRPQRVLDTRPDTNFGAPPAKIGAQQTISVQVGGVKGIPAEATAVVVNITALQGTENTFVTVSPTGGQTPSVSNLNPQAGETLANLAIVKLGDGGKVNVFNRAGETNALLDITGYFASGSASKYRPVAPQRLYDSRKGAGPFVAGELRGLKVGGVLGVPAGATAVVLNVTAVGATAPSFINVTPGNVSSTDTSNINVANIAAVPNAVVVGLSAEFFNIYNHGGSVHIVVDVTGYFVNDTSSAGRYVPLTPVRVVNTRDEPQWGGRIGPLEQRYIGIHRYFKRSDAAAGPGLFPFETSAVVMNTTVTHTTGDSYLTVFPVQPEPPEASNVNWSAGQTRANLVLTGMNQWGQISVFNLRGQTDVLLDVAGYFTT